MTEREFLVGADELTLLSAGRLREFFTDEALHEKHDCGQWEPA